VKVRGKVRNRVLRRGGTVAGLAVGALLAFWLLGAALRTARSYVGSRLLSLRPSVFEVNCPSPEVSASARALLAGAMKEGFTSARCAGIAAELKRLHPGLSSVSVGRNFFTGKAIVSASPEAVVSPVLLAGATAYLGASGRILPENLSGQAGAGLPVEIGWPAAEAPGLAVFLSELKPLLPLFYSRPAALECPGSDWACLLRLEDGSTVLWGGFEFTRLKVIRLNEVVKDASLKRPGPFRVDMRYFREGKILVSAAKQPQERP
jgi:hypothetical protein